MQSTASNERGPPPLRSRAGTPAAKSPSIVQVGGNNGASLDRAGMMLSGGADVEIDQLPVPSDGTPEHSATESH